MANNYLITGLHADGSGKTTFARALLTYLNEKGVCAQGYKPRAGNDFYTDYGAIRQAMQRQSIYGIDVRLLSECSCLDVEIEKLNPVHRLFYLGRFILDRVSLDEDYFFVNNVSMPALIDDFLNKRKNVIQVEGMQAINQYAKDYHLDSGVKSLISLMKKTDSVVLESYCDTALPIWNYAPDKVYVVQPGAVHEVSADKFLKAHNLQKGRYLEAGGREVLMKRIMELVDPELSIRLPPLTYPSEMDDQSLLKGYRKVIEELDPI